MQLINPMIESSIRNFESAMDELAEKVGESTHHISERIQSAKKTSVNLVAAGAVLLTTVFLVKKLRRR